MDNGSSQTSDLTYPSPPITVEPDLRVGFILSPRFTLLSFAGFVDCLRHAADEADHSRQIHCSWSVIAPSLEPVEASCGVHVIPLEIFPDPTSFDYVIVVGGLLPWCLDQPRETYDYLRTAYASNISVAGLCTGSFVLAKAGLLDGRRCAVHTEHYQHFVRLFPSALPETDQIYVNDQGLYTCPGGTTALDLAFSLIEEHCGKARALKGLMSLLVEKHRAALHVPHRPYEKLTACGNWRVERSIDLMGRYISRPFSIEQLADRIGSSYRELARAFSRRAGQSPAAIWRKMRLSHGHWLLLNTARTVTRIAHECGFADGAHFSRWFKREYGEPPARFRRHRRSV